MYRLASSSAHLEINETVIIKKSKKSLVANEGFYVFDSI